MKKHISLLIIMLTLFTAAFTVSAMTIVYDDTEHEYNEREIKLFVNGTEVTELPMPPVLLFGRVYVPVREMFESMGATVTWSANENRVYIGYGYMVGFQLESRLAMFNDEIVSIPVPPKLINNKTMIPVRFASEMLGFKVGWDENNSYVFIDEIPATAEKNKPDGETTAANSADTVTDTGTAQEVTQQDYKKSTYNEYSVDISSRELTNADFPQTRISKIIMSETGGSKYIIQADSPISKVSKLLLSDNRLVIDFFDAIFALDKSVYDLPDAPFLKSIRSSQWSDDPEMITRVVFDITEPVCFSVSMSDDRTQIIIEIEQNHITDVKYYSDGKTDTVEITGAYPPTAMKFPLTNPDRLVIDLPMSVLDGMFDKKSDGRFASGIRTGQFTKDTARVVVDLKNSDVYDYSSYMDGNTLVIKLSEPNYRNLSYNNEKMLLSIPKKSGIDLDISKIIHKDRYDILKYSFVLPGDYSSYLGHGEKPIRDEFIKTIEISTIYGITEITFNETEIMAFNITEDDENIYFMAVPPKEKYRYIVVLDPGHGGKAIGADGGAGLFEKDINFDIAQKIAAHFQSNPESGIKVYMTRTTDVDVSLEGRAAFGNLMGDLFVSIHHNSWTNIDTNGTETYYHEHPLPNEYKFTSKQAADILQKNMAKDLELENRGVKNSPYMILKYSKIPAVLAEVAFLSNPEDLVKIKMPEFRQKSADSIRNAIIEIFTKYNPPR